MLEHYFKRPRVQVRLKSNVLHDEIEKLIVHLHTRGYRPESIQSYLQKVEHFGNWLKVRNIPKRSIDKDTVHLFLYKHLPKCKCGTSCPVGFKDVRAALYQLLCILPSSRRGSKQISEITPIAKEIRKFKAYMDNICCYSGSTSSRCT